MKVIFLDIDGVLQPYSSGKRFKIDRKALVSELSKKYNIDYSIYDEYDAAAAYCDWDKDGVKRIKKILKKTNAKIVISSSWRSEKTPNKMRDFLRFYDLDKYLIGQTRKYSDITEKDNYKKYHYRVIEILDYLEKHQDITSYVVIDDMDLSIGLENHFVETNNIINDNQMKECIRILKYSTWFYKF